MIYQYQATLSRVVDGDTVVLDIDVGFRVYMRLPIRLYGINAPELNTEEGKKARDFLSIAMTDPRINSISVQTFKNPRDKYGRWLGIIFVDDVNLNQHLVEAGHATEVE